MRRDSFRNNRHFSRSKGTLKQHRRDLRRLNVPLRMCNKNIRQVKLNLRRLMHNIRKWLQGRIQRWRRTITPVLRRLRRRRNSIDSRNSRRMHRPSKRASVNYRRGSIHKKRRETRYPNRLRQTRRFYVITQFPTIAMSG